jgi:hypothetical protein
MGWRFMPPVRPREDAFMLLRRTEISTILNVAIAIPIMLAFAISVAAGVGIGRVSDYANLAINSSRILHESHEFSTVVERTARFINEPGSQ